MTSKTVEGILAAKRLKKSGGEIFRTIGSLPDYVTPEQIIAAANDRGLGHRIMHGKLYIFAPA